MTAKVLKKSELDKKTGLQKEVDQIPKHKTIDIDLEEGGVLDKRTMVAKDKAEKMILQAEAEADKIRTQAKKILAEVEAVREKAIKDGFEKGQQQGLAEVTEKLVQLEAIREKFYAQAEPELIKLATAIAEKVIGQIVIEKPEVIMNVVKQALERSLGDRITIKLNPEDYKTIQESNFEFRDILDRTKRLHLKEDDTIAKGGCVVETEVGTIDAQIETQLEAIKKALEI
ncbi:MAG: FliH/SctL family protein [Pseudomonadota bacterium]